MSMRFDHYVRLEQHPQDGNFETGFAAEVHDPVWFLSRQWQMGEHQGENASSPVSLRYETELTPIQPFQGNADYNPTEIPAEAIVESELDDWWTMGRRITLGNTIVTAGEFVAAHLSREEYLFRDAPPPYDHFNGEAYDGLRLWRDRDKLLNDAAVDLVTILGADAPPPFEPYCWNSEQLVYTAEFNVADQCLRLERHRGGVVDWYSADLVACVNPPAEPLPASTEVNRLALPTQLQYPGAPNRRWWEIEDSAVDIGGYPPDPSQFATTLLIDLIASHSDDWFLFPVESKVGNVITIKQITVTDSFDIEYVIEKPEADPWRIFETTGMSGRSMVLWLSALAPLRGQPLENVLLGLDEFSNKLWAVERRIDGRAVGVDHPELTPEEDNPPINGKKPSTDTITQKEYVYIPGKNLLPYWHPYEMEDLVDANGVPQRRLVQRRLIDLSRQRPQLMPPAEAEVLRVRSGNAEYVHQISPSTVPSIGIELERRYMLARDVYGRPVLWMQRERMPFLTPPTRKLRFDVMEEVRN